MLSTDALKSVAHNYAQNVTELATY